MKYSWQFRAQCYCVVSKLRLNTTTFLTVQCSRVSVVWPGTHNPCLVRVILILAGEYRHDCTTQSNISLLYADICHCWFVKVKYIECSPCHTGMVHCENCCIGLVKGTPCFMGWYLSELETSSFLPSFAFSNNVLLTSSR